MHAFKDNENEFEIRHHIHRVKTQEANQTIKTKSN